jgi:hypothetical protein
MIERVAEYGPQNHDAFRDCAVSLRLELLFRLPQHLTLPNQEFL